jgi:hypothetical protein
MMNERNLVWNDDLKLRLIKRAVSDELGVSEEEVEARLQVRAAAAAAHAAGRGWAGRLPALRSLGDQRRVTSAG